MIEALRGKLLAASGPADADDDDRRSRRIAGAADCLARALERQPLGGPLAAVAGLIAAQHWHGVPDPRAVLASVARARPLAGGKLVDELDLCEVGAIADSDPKAAEQRVDALLARSREDADAWKMKVELARLQGEGERAEAIILEAAAVTRDPRFAVLARAVQAKRGVLVPFEGFVPGTASAGALARELALVTTGAVDPYPLAASHRAALGPAARLAFDAAALVIAVQRGAPAASEARLREGLLTWRSSPKDLHRLAGVAAQAGLADLVPAAALALGDDVPALRACAEALGAAGESKGVRRLLPLFAASLTREEVTLFKGLSSAGPRLTRAGIPPPEEAVRELDLALAPDFSIADLLRDGAGPVEEAEDAVQDLAEDFLAELFDAFGIHEREIRALPPDVVRRAHEKLGAILQKGPPRLQDMETIMEVLAEIGIDLPSVMDRQTAKKKKGKR